MGAPGTTPGPWWVRTRERNGEIFDCFVAAKDVNGFPYDAEILGDDEYCGDIGRRLADAAQIAASSKLYDALEGLLKIRSGRTVKAAREALAEARSGAKQ